MVARRGGRALAAEHLDLAGLGRVEHRRHLARRADQMRLDDLQDEAGGDAGVEGVAARLQHRHAGGGGQPVSRGDDAEGAEDFRPCGEHVVSSGLMS